MEKRDLYDKNGIYTNEIIKKGEKIPKNKFIKIVVIFIQNSKGEYLIQKRSEKFKDGKWGTTGGHLISGEDSLSAVLRETKEEIGINLTKEEVELTTVVKTEKYFVHIYYAKKDINIQDLVLQEEEVDEVKWENYYNIKKLMREGKFLQTHMLALDRCIDSLETINAEYRENKKDLTIQMGEYKLNCRAAGIIIHNNKLLVHKNINKDHYGTIGGRIEAGEDSCNTVKREIKEELGKDVEIIDFLGIVENFFEMKNCKYHEYLFLYRAEFIDDNDKKIEKTLQNIEGKDYLIYEWIDIDKLYNYNILPVVVKDVLKSKSYPVHIIKNYD